MTEFKFIEQNYDYRDYTAVVVQPAKWQITTSALKELKEFILRVEHGAMEDYRLTKKQNQLMNILSQGLELNDAIEIMNIKMTSIKTHLKGVYNTYGVNKMYQAVVKFMQNTERLKDE